MVAELLHLCLLHLLVEEPLQKCCLKQLPSDRTIDLCPAILPHLVLGLCNVLQLVSGQLSFLNLREPITTKIIYTSSTNT